MLRDSPNVATREPIYDAAVIGAGIVGLAAAVALARDGYRIALVERSPPERHRGALGFDLRSVALAPGSVDFLRALGGIDDADLAPIEAMHVWEYDGSASLRFTGDGCDCLCGREQRIDDPSLGSCGGLPGHRAADFGYGTRRDTRWRVRRGARHMRPILVIGADGADSIVRKLAHASQRVAALLPRRLATCRRDGRACREAA